MSSRCGTICPTQIFNNPPLNKESPCKLIFTPGRPSSHLEDICSMLHALREAQLAGYYSSSLRLPARLTWSRIPLPISRVQLALQEPLLRLFCALGIEQVLSPPQTKSLSLPASRSSSLLHPRRSYSQSRSLLFTELETTRLYMKNLEHSYLSRELNLYKPNLTGAHCIFRCALGNRTSPTHTICKDSGTIPKD